MFDSGWVAVGQFRGAPVRIHWSIVVGALFFGGLAFVPVFWAAFFGLILVHEVGHAVLVRWNGLRVVSVDVHGFGGMCRWTGITSPLQHAGIAWGGVLAQFVVFLMATAVVWVVGRPTGSVGIQLVDVLIDTNLLFMMFNLLPIPPLDGSEAWKFFPLMRNRWRRLQAKKRKAEIEAELDLLNAIDRQVRDDNRPDDDIWN